MNLCRLPILRAAADLMAAMDMHAVEHPEERGGLTCCWESEMGSAPCRAPAEYFVPGGTRVSTGGDIETLMTWYCTSHMEHALGGPVQPQPLFGRIEGFDLET